MARTRQSRTPGPSGNPRSWKQGRVSKLAANCLEAGFAAEKSCSSCQLFYNAIPVERRFNLKQLLKKRSQTHKSDRYKCRKPWEMDPDGANDPLVPLIEHQMKQLALQANTLFVSDDEDDVEQDNNQQDKPETEDKTESSSASLPLVLPPDEDQNDTSDDTKNSVKVDTHTIFSQGCKFVIENVPISHAIVPKAHLKRLQNKEKAVDSLRKQYKRTRYPAVGMKTRAAIAAALASVKTLAIKAAQYFVPLIIAAFLFKSNLLSYRTFDIIKYAAPFPSKHYYRTLIYEQASMCLYSFGKTLEGKHVFLACDKGNKKGVGHFVKMLSFWNGTLVEFKCLDMDASEGTTEACACAVEYSLRKVGGIKLQGTTTDSGGGGVLDSLADALKEKGICNDNYKVAGCSIHTFQLTLKNPTEKSSSSPGAPRLLLSW